MWYGDRMLYGDAKTAQIARSVLPATRNKARSARKDKRQWNQRARTRLDRDLKWDFHRGMTAADAIEAWDHNPSPWIDAYTTRERKDMDYIRDERRLADNLGPIRAWTAAQVGLFDNPADLIADLSRRLPMNLAGRHALSHMDTEFGPDLYGYGNYKEIMAERRQREADKRRAWQDDIRVVISYSLKELNRRIRVHNRDSLGCDRRNYIHEDGVPVWRQHTVPCGGRIVLDDTNRYTGRVPCLKCGGAIQNNNIPEVSSVEDVNALVSRKPYGVTDLFDWIEHEAERQRSFTAEPVKIERRKALSCFLGSRVMAVV